MFARQGMQQKSTVYLVGHRHVLSGVYPEGKLLIGLVLECLRKTKREVFFRRIAACSWVL